MIIDVDPSNCTGCRMCEVFCSMEQEGLIQPDLSRLQVLKDEAHNLFLPIVCPPCADRACMQACPEPGAMALDPQSGAVVIVESLCTGCSRCIRACEIGAIHLLRQTGRGKNGKAVAFKCNQCGGDPWCVRVCEPRALVYRPDGQNQAGQQVFESLRLQRLEAESARAQRGGRPRQGVAVR